MLPSEEIFCTKSRRLYGKTIVLGITGSIAAVESFHLIRELVRHGAKVIPVMSQEALRLVTADAMEFASGIRPITEITGRCEHIEHLGSPSDADMLMIYPCTADTISKIANGIADTPVTTMAAVALGGNVPVVIAPAMHGLMMQNPAVEKNLNTLKKMGVFVIGPHDQNGRSRVASVEEMTVWAGRMMSRDDLLGNRILIIGGRSEEPIDSMRLITNRSTGLMAVTLARAAFERGAEVDLWMGACNVELPDYIPVRRFETVGDLMKMVKNIEHDVVIVPAALADFSPKKTVKGKITSDKGFTMDLESVPKVLPEIRKKCAKVIGFKAESGLSGDALKERAKKRLKEYDLTAIVANDIDAAGKQSAAMILVTADRVQDISGTKNQISDGILNYVSETIRK